MTGTRNYFALAHAFGFEGKNFSYNNSILEHAKPFFWFRRCQQCLTKLITKLINKKRLCRNTFTIYGSSGQNLNLKVTGF